MTSTSCGCATDVSRSPHRAIAFRFFDPITAPTPPRPAWRPSLLIVAKRTRFSPAVPMDATHAVGQFNSERMNDCVSPGVFPLRWSGGSDLNLLAVDEHVDQWAPGR